MSARKTRSVSIIGCGFVADLYMRSFAAHPDIAVTQVYDHDPDRLRAFADHWHLHSVESLARFLGNLPEGSLILNLTNPEAHYEISRSCLEAGHHVYSEKPLAMEMSDAIALHELAAQKGVLLASAPCSVLGETAQTLAKAVREEVAGPVRLIYAELDDGFIPQAPYADWRSESGAPWPAQDEFAVGCTLEHAGYYLTWLIAMFGAVRRVVAASAECLPDKGQSGGTTTPDYASATLFFENGLTARLTCSIVASHDHSLRLFGDRGVLKIKQAWDNEAAVRFHRRFTLRRRLIEHPIGKRVSLSGDTHPKVDRWGAAAMNFALGPAEMLDALAEERPCRLSADFALHLNEVTLAIQNAEADGCAQDMSTRCDPLPPMPWAL
ncbi:Gfo/Idh/MocA family protein [Shimia marina]|uniref:Putative oxidoreductase YvaA n=1 Tax=Shimia marina TaxID=321267 RepID=A0A0P1EKY2_9RHOB|nr:Gfo/Idh/MocA family oxidoreductase [Shimia marina]CUH51133.1 putative oxidoreductase YvaA [Shimia marina]SFD57304.1 Predicted dehydrogenase [Shimia marina]